MMHSLPYDHDRSRTTGTRRRSRRLRGCLAVFAIAIVVLSAGVYFLGKPVRAAKRIEQQLNDRFQDATAFVPATDGSIPAARIEAFLRVRRAVNPYCDSLASLEEDAANLDRLESDAESTGPVKLASALSNLRRLFSYGPRFLEFMNARNTALLDEDMGLGEYMYIYALAYGEQLQAAADSIGSETGLADVDAYGVPSRRARRELAQILRNQMAALPVATPADSAWSAALSLQIEALANDEIAAPWVRRRPAASERSLAPYDAALTDLFCPGLARFELMQKNKGLQIEG